MRTAAFARWGLALVSIFATSAHAASCDIEMQMTAERIGPVKLGMSEAELLSLGANPSVLVTRNAYFSEENGANEVNFEIAICGDAKISADFFDTTSVYSISTTSSEFATLEGSRVGVTAGELKLIYESGRNINFWNEGVVRSFVVDDGRHGVFVFGKGRCGVGDDYVSRDCNEILPDEVSVRYWTNGAYTKPKIWAR